MQLPYDFYENGFGYIRLENLSLGKLPQKLEINGDELVLKPEFHISLVWAGRLSEIIDVQNKDKIKNEIIREFEKYTEEKSLADYKLTGELRLVEKDSQKTVIAMAKVANLEAFFMKLNQKYNTKLPLQPAHITLYTLPTDKIGIGILSEEELQKYSSTIDIPEIKSTLNRD